jgi:CBS domain containing-hemolysin-like protein
VDRTRLEQRAEAGERRARVALAVLRRLSFSLSGAQLGITVVSLVLGFIAEPVIARLLAPALEPVVGTRAADGVAIVLALLLATVAQMVLGELIPKGVAIARPEGTTLVLAPAVRLYNLVFGPVISLLNGAANWTVRRLGVEPREELSHVRSLPELALIIQASAEEGTLAGNASTLLRRSIRFGEKTAGDVLVPRTQLDALACDDTALDLARLAVSSGHSRFPVFGTDLDDVRGVVHAKAVHAVRPADRATTPVSALMTPVPAVPETRGIEDVLTELRRSRTHLAVVIDEYGGTAGVVTLEDIVEEIVGDISDEHDPFTVSPAVREGAGEYVLAGSLHPDEVLEATGFVVPEGDYGTIAGFVLDRLGRVPSVGDVFDHAGWQLEVVEMDRRRVARIRLREGRHGAAHRGSTP